MTQRDRAADRFPARGGGRVPGRDGGAAGRDGGARRPAGDRPRGGDLPARRARLRDVVEPVVTAAGYDLEDLSVSRAGRRYVVRVIVDRDSGVSLDAVAEVSRAVSVALDAAEESSGELLTGEYQLEVSSPGVDRPLTLPRHWRRNIGRLVKVSVKAPGGPGEPSGPGVSASGRQVTGRLIAADADRVVLDVNGATGEWAYPQLGPGRVQVEFSRLDEVTEEDLHDIGDTEDNELEDEER